MNISYDIFDLADFPVVLTDRNFIITYKNNLAAKLFGKLRKRSKIIRHFRNFNNSMDFSDINELDIETGTHFMRALVFPIEDNSLVFLFFTIYAFTDTKNLLEHVREYFAGNLLDFYCAAYSEYNSAEKASFYEKSVLSERAYSELMFLSSSFSDKPEFMCAEVFSLNDILDEMTKKLSLLSPFGLSIHYPVDYGEPCYSKINLKYFTFSIFRLIYMAFKLSRTGKLQLKTETVQDSFVYVTVSTESALTGNFSGETDFSSLVAMLPEFSFEFEILGKLGILEDSFSFSIKNSILQLYYKVKLQEGCNFIVRSEPPELRKKRIEKAVSEAFAKIKLLLSQIKKNP